MDSMKVHCEAVLMDKRMAGLKDLTTAAAKAIQKVDATVVSMASLKVDWMGYPMAGV